MTIPVVAQNETIETFYKNGKYDKVISILKDTESYKELSMREYFMLTRSYGRTGQFTNGYILASKMIDIANKKNDTNNLLKAFNLKAENITDLRKIKEGVSFCDSITPLFRKKDSIELMKLCFKCGMLYHYNSDYERAFKTYKKITKKEYKALLIYNNNLAIILIQLKKYNEALKHLKESIKIAKKKNVKKGLNVSYNNIGQIYLLKSEWEKAKKYFDSSYNVLFSNNKMNILYNKKRLFKNYYELYITQGKTKEATAFLDSIYKNNEVLLRKIAKEKIYSIEAANKNENFLVKKVVKVDKQLTVSKDQKLQVIIILLSVILALLVIMFLFIPKIRKTFYLFFILFFFKFQHYYLGFNV